MGLLKRLLNFYIDSSIHVALSVSALVIVTCYLYESVPTIYFISFVFLATVTGYNFVKYAAIAGLHHRRLTKSLKSIQVFSLLCFVLLLFFAFRLSFSTLLFSAAFALLTLFYAIPVFRNRNLRNFSGLKIFIVALVWAGVTVIVPLIDAGIEIENTHFLTFLQRFLFVIVLILPFDIRDVDYDSLALGTIVQKIGVLKTKILGAVLMLIWFLLEFFKPEKNLEYLISFAFAGIILISFLFFAKRNQNKYYASFWVEAVPIMWLAVYILAGHLLA